MTFYDYSAAVSPEGSHAIEKVAGRVEVDAADDDLIDEAVYNDIQERNGWSRDKDAFLEIFTSESDEQE